MNHTGGRKVRSGNGKDEGSVPLGPLRPIPAKDAADSGAEPEDKGNKGSERHPVGVAIVCGIALVSEAVAGDAEEDHIDDPYDKGDDCGQTGRDRHDDCPKAMGGEAAEAEENGDEGEEGRYMCERTL